MNEFLCFQPNLVRELEIYASFIMIYDPVANFETHPLEEEQENLIENGQELNIQYQPIKEVYAGRKF